MGQGHPRALGMQKSTARPVFMQLDIKSCMGPLARGHSTSPPTHWVLASCHGHRARASLFEYSHRTLHTTNIAAFS